MIKLMICTRILHMHSQESLLMSLMYNTVDKFYFDFTSSFYLSDMFSITHYYDIYYFIN